ncbi:MAG: TetR/AcrR family transcriptional regulator [Porticoccaceae bacterium]|jgi:AcrR family transcriptional regulator|nr:TetR/AcrR family transcriptional regulator [Porticoccaceae bacterium]
MTKSRSSPEKIDGRRLRSGRSRQLIIESMLQLIKDGNLAPTAKQVANHAKVGIRSVFRHFEDMEAIFATADELWRKELYHGLPAIDPQLPVKQRISLTAEELGTHFEDHAYILKSTATRRWRSTFLKHNYAGYQDEIRAFLKICLPEIENLNASKQEAIVGILSFEYWDRLRDHQYQTPTACIDAIVDLLNSLISPT